jgi:thiol:disulfide interchange protein DsbC
MKTVRFARILLAGGFMLLGVNTAFAMDVAEVKKRFAGAFSEVAELIQGVSETPVAGIYEMATKEGDVLYFAPATGHLLVGKLYDRDGKDLAEGTRNRIALEKLQVYVRARERAITIGSGPVEVIEITNPDCGYCRKLSKHLDRRPELTRRIFMATGPEAAQEAKYVAAAADQARALREVMSGLYDNDADFATRTYDDKGLIDEHLKLAEQAEVSATPMVIINGSLVSGADLEAIDQLIEKARSGKKTAQAGTRGEPK